MCAAFYAIFLASSFFRFERECSPARRPLTPTIGRLQTVPTSLRHALNACHGPPPQFPSPGRILGEPPQATGPQCRLRLDMLAMAEAYVAILGLDARRGPHWPETAHDLGLEICSHEESR